MANSDWCSLHTHTEYSLLDGASKHKDLVQKAVDQDMKAIAMTDHGNMYGTIPFYKECKKAGIKPIIGCELYVAERTRHDKDSKLDKEIYHLTVLAKDNEGYQNLIKLVTASHLEGFYYKPRVDHELLEKFNKGLIVLSGCLGGELAQAVNESSTALPETIFDWYKQVFGDRYYLEMQDHGIAQQEYLNFWIGGMRYQSVATNDLHYVNQGDAHWHEVMLCMQTQRKMTDENRFKFANDQFYLKSHLALPEAALRASLDIADQCNVDIPIGEQLLPPFAIPDDYTDAMDYLSALSISGMQDKYGRHGWNVPIERLDEELTVIQQTSFETYFLILWDIYRFAREQSINVGPGRGSAAGSLVAYCLGITDVDPIKYGLMFERFLNKDRVSMPDIDCDFSVNGREKIINYVSEKYGNVAQIITFNTMTAKAAIKDVGRALDISYTECDRLSKLVPSVHGKLRTIKECRESIPEFITDSNLLDIAEAVEGLTKGIGTHAAGVVISPDDLTNHVPLQMSPDKTTLITQYDMNALQDLGLLKMDFLGLENLDIIETCLRLIGGDVEFREDDPKTYELIAKGLTTGVFQLGSDGMKGMLRELKPTQFNDIVVAVALWRPGPMQYLGSYIKRKHGREEVEYLHPLLKDVLEDTYGLLVYQEQTMKAAQVLAGFSLSEADVLRAAMGKKDREKMKGLKDKFVTGCIYKEDGSGMSEKEAEAIFDQIEAFSDYAFNRAHATSYALTAYRTAFLKANYPIQYMTALFSHAKDLEGIAEIYRDCQKMGIDVLPPHINASNAEFGIDATNDPVNQVGIRFGLAAIRNVGKQAAQCIVKEREQEHFRDREDFCYRMKQYREINIKAISALANSGAFGEISNDNLYALDYIFAGNPDLKLEMPAMGSDEKMRREREYLGIHLTKHPLEMIKTLDNTISDMLDLKQVTMAAYITGVRKIETRNKKQMAYLQLEDLTGTCEAVVFPQTFYRVSRLLEVGKVLKISGAVETNNRDDDTKLQLVVRNMETI